MEKISICIPLGKRSGWHDNELMYTLRSLEKHMKIPYEVFIFADKRNDLSWTRNVKVRKIARTYPSQAQEHFGGVKHYENYFDVLHKIEAMVMDDEVSEQFVVFYDDTHLNMDVTRIEDLVLFVAIRHYKTAKDAYDRRKGKWLKTVMEAMDKLRFNSKPMYDYESHLPRFYLKKNWKVLFKKFPVDRQLIPYAPSTLYINWFYDKPTVDLSKEENNVKAGFYGEHLCKDIGAFSSNTEKVVRKAIQGKMFINYNDFGMNDALKNILKELYPNKSKFEK
jgi:hypothetical protein